MQPSHPAGSRMPPPQPVFRAHALPRPTTSAGPQSKPPPIAYDQPVASSPAQHPPNMTNLCSDHRLGKYIQRDSDLFDTLGWEELVRQRRARGDLTDMSTIKHPARNLLKHLSTSGAPAALRTQKWSADRLEQAIRRGPHKSCDEYHEFLEEEFGDFVEKAQWIVLPFSKVKHMKGLRLSPPGVVPQRGRRPRLIADLTFYLINDDTIRMAPAEAMQFGRALERLIHSIVFANPHHGPVHLKKVDMSDGFYRVWLQMGSSPCRALVLPPLGVGQIPPYSSPKTMH